MALTDDRLAEIRADWAAMETAAVVDLLAEVDRLNGRLNAVVSVERIRMGLKSTRDAKNAATLQDAAIALALKVKETEADRDRLAGQAKQARHLALREAIDIVTAQQAKDTALKLICGPFRHSSTCHDSEAYAAHERALSALRTALRGGAPDA